jgi:hypothetical protein
LGGRRVPILLAVMPASIVAIAITAAGLGFTFAFFAVQLQLVPAEGDLFNINNIWGTIGPMLLWIPWGVALGLATIAYYYRRREQCLYCGRSDS